MSGMIFRCGHPRTPENTTGIRDKRCKCCTRARDIKRGRYGTRYMGDDEDGEVSRESMAASSDMLLRKICGEHLAIVAHLAKQGRKVRVLL